MRIFVGLLGGLFLLLGIVGFGAGGFVGLDNSYDDPDYTCSAGSSTTTCYASGDSAAQAQTASLGLLVVGGSLFVGGCALLGGAAAAGRKPAVVTQQAAPVPVAASGPPVYGGGGGAWQGSAPAGGDRS